MTCRVFGLVAVLSALAMTPGLARAQALPACDGTDVRGAGEAFTQGNALMQQATTEARARHRDRARALAEEALGHFDRQCAMGDDSALAERGAALILMGEALRSAQSYDAYLARHPLDSLDPRTRHRVEPNLQPGTVEITLHGRSEAHVFVDGLDFGPIARTGPLRLPLGDHDLEAREGARVVLTHHASLTSASASDAWTVEGAPEPPPTPPPVETTTPVVSHEIAPPPPPRTDFTAWYLATGIGTAALAGTAIVLHVLAADRASAYDAVCVRGPGVGCESARGERDGLFGGAIAADVLAGVFLVGLVTTLALDLSQPSAPPGTSARCTFGPLGARCAGTF